MFTTHKITHALGFLFLVIGILGFFSNPLVGHDGFFQTDMMHNLVHMVTGGALLLSVYHLHQDQMMMKVFGVIYLAMALLGFFHGSMLSWMVMNTADHWLHLVVGLGMMYTGFMMKE